MKKTMLVIVVMFLFMPVIAIAEDESHHDRKNNTESAIQKLQAQINQLKTMLQNIQRTPAVQGSIGLTGPAGPAGAIGPAGPAGAIGPAGPAGA